nr:MAG TPA: hypothetical protein [Caudoviricetes sp.]
MSIELVPLGRAHDEIPDSSDDAVSITKISA